MRQEPIAVLGLGGMGAGMARALLRAGANVVVYNRSPGRAVPLAELGAKVAASAADAATDARVVVLSLSDQAAVEQVLFGELDCRLKQGTIVVDTSTLAPAYAKEAEARVARSGVRRVEACVLGNPPMAEAGKLRVFTAGEESAVDEVSDVLDAIGQETRHLGSTGSASALKLSFSLMLGIQLLGLAEAVKFVEAMGIDRDQLLDAFESSGWRSAVLSYRGQFMRSREYRPAAFRAALMHKDLGLARDEALERTELPMLRCALDQFAAVFADGYGDDDAAIVSESMSSTERPGDTLP